MSFIIKHEFESCDDEKDFIPNKDANMTVGSTGTGKSSLIKLFCGNNVVVGHGTNSQTQDSSLHRESNDKYWLDSQGANDSNGTEDEKVLTDILRTLYNNKIGKIKIIWCVSGDLCREKMEFKTQAKFISSLGQNVWKSCLIIVKDSKLSPNKMNGVLAAANRYGANIQHGDVRLLGFRALEYGGNQYDDDELYNMIQEIQNTQKRDQRLKESGFLKNNEIKQLVNDKLRNVQPLKLKFSVEECIKCGVKGDPRFVFAPCHRTKEQYHPKSLVPYHPGSLQSVHIGVIKQEAIRDIEYYHPRAFDEAGVGTVLAHVATFSISSWFKAANGTLQGVYPCCDKGYAASGCCSRMITTGHVSKYSCCDGAPNSTGCRREYSCCGGSERSMGCSRKYKCCNNVEGSVGCSQRCQSCYNQWGKGPGCVKTTQ